MDPNSIYQMNLNFLSCVNKHWTSAGGNGNSNMYNSRQLHLLMRLFCQLLLLGDIKGIFVVVYWNHLKGNSLIITQFRRKKLKRWGKMSGKKQISTRLLLCSITCVCVGVSITVSLKANISLINQYAAFPLGCFCSLSVWLCSLLVLMLSSCFIASAKKKGPKVKNIRLGG